MRAGCFAGGERRVLLSAQERTQTSTLASTRLRLCRSSISGVRDCGVVLRSISSSACLICSNDQFSGSIAVVVALPKSHSLIVSAMG